MAERYEHTGNAAPTTLSAGISNSDTAIPITSGTGWPTGTTDPFWVTIDAGTASEEKVLVASRSGTTLTVSERGADGTAAASHSSGATIEHTFSATEADDANELAAQITTLGGTPLTTSAAQTVTGKSVALGSNTVTGTKAQFDTAVTDGNFAYQSDIAGLLLMGELGYADTTDTQSGITAAADLTDLADTVTVGTGRRVKITAHIRSAGSTVDTDDVVVRLKEDSTELTYGQTKSGSIDLMVVLSPTAGEHTYKLTAERTGTGSAQVNGGSLLIEDIGAA